MIERIIKFGDNTQQIYANCVQFLKANGVENAAFDANELMTFAIDKDRRIHKDYIPNQSQVELLRQYIKRRANREPLQYILKTWNFYGFDLHIGKGVLIPRQDTETVCEIAIELMRNYKTKQGQTLQIADLCAGSGAITIALANNLENAQLTALELHDDAYSYLEQNTQKFAPSASLIKADVFSYNQAAKENFFDMIISNPPYISHSEEQFLMPELKFEPQSALFAEDDGLMFYKHIAAKYKSKLKKGGFMVFEIGSSQALAVSEILGENKYTSINTKQDAQGKDRCVYAIAK